MRRRGLVVIAVLAALLVLLAAGSFVHAIQARQGLQIACLEEIAMQSGWIGPDRLVATADTMRNSQYGRYLRDLIS